MSELIQLSGEAIVELKPKPLPDTPDPSIAQFSDADMKMFREAVEADRAAEAQARVNRRKGRIEIPETPFREDLYRRPAPFETSSDTEVDAPTCWSPSLNSDTHEITLYPGSINGLVPSNMFDTFSVSGTQYIVATCTTDGSQINAITLAVESSPPTPAAATSGAAPLSFKVLITIFNDDLAYNMGGCGMTFVPQESIRVDKVSPTPGTLPYTSWYVWSRTL